MRLDSPSRHKNLCHSTNKHHALPLLVSTGMRYAMQALKVAVASVLLRFEVTPAPEQVLPVERDPAAPILGFKGGVWLRFRPVS